MNRRRVAALLRELADELESATPTAEDQHDEHAPRRPPRAPRAKPDHERAARALKRAGVYPAGAWRK